MANYSGGIIVVDDDPLFRRSVSILLSRYFKKQVLSFENAEVAWNYIEQARGVNIILSDINMPGMDGLEFLQLVKERYPAKIVILMSGYSVNRQIALNLGADAYIDKPFSIKEISGLINFFESFEKESLSA